MQIINIFIAIIVALGFWRKSKTEQDLKTAKSSFTKTFILFVLTLGVCFFYYKTYQVATFKNYITVSRKAGSVDTYIEKYTYSGEEYEFEHIVPRDRITSLTLINSYANNEFDYFDPQRDLTRGRTQSGVIVKMIVDRNISLDSDTSFVSDQNRPKNYDQFIYCYDVSLMTNTVPSLFPFTFYEESVNKGFSSELDDSTIFKSYAKSLPPSNDIFKDYDKLYGLRLASYNIEDKLEDSMFSDLINTLNFFSAADLSQCQYMFIIRSSVPIDDFKVCFDVPIEVSSAGVNQSKLDSREFSVNIEEKEDGIVDKVAIYHVKFPTLSNLQLIRSLILTTLLTALISLFLTNLYYWCRKQYLAYLKRHHNSYRKIKLIYLLWIPTGRIITWSFVLLFFGGLILSILGITFRFDAGYILLYKMAFFFFLFLYIIVVCVIMYILYRRKIYAKDMKSKLVSYYKYMKTIPRSIKMIIFKKNKRKSNTDTEERDT